MELEELTQRFPRFWVEGLLDTVGTGLDPLLDTGRSPATWLADLRLRVQRELDAHGSLPADG